MFNYSKFDPSSLETTGAKLINNNLAHHKNQNTLIRDQLKKGDLTVAVAKKIGNEVAEYLTFQKIYFVGFAIDNGDDVNKFPSSFKAFNSAATDIARDYFHRPLGVKWRFSSLTFSQIVRWIESGAKVKDMPRVSCEVVEVKTQLPKTSTNPVQKTKGANVAPLVQAQLPIEDKAHIQREARKGAIQSATIGAILKELSNRINSGEVSMADVTARLTAMVDPQGATAKAEPKKTGTK